MLSPFCLLTFSVLLGLAVRIQQAPDPNYVVNGGFENGLSGWKTSGDISVETRAPLDGKSSLRLGIGEGSVSQSYTIPGLRIMEFGATARFDSKDDVARIRVVCYDKENHVLMDLKQVFDTKKAVDPKGLGTGIYFKTHAYTNHVVVSIEKLSRSFGSVLVDKVELHDYDHDRKEHAPECDLDQYMKPVWQGDTVYDESVLLLSTNGSAPSGSLLFHPTRVLAVKDSLLKTEFAEGKDFRVDGNKIIALAGSRMPTLKQSDFPKGAYPWLSVIGKHIVVTYAHSDSWRGPIPTYQGDSLHHTFELLKSRRPMTIVAFGDSITLGINVSGYRNEPPYMPTWPDLFTRDLKKHFHNDRITLYNTALGGMTSGWGKDNAEDAVASLNPDLVLLAFGMNDFWSLSPAEYRSNIEKSIEIIRAKRPNAEFVLVASIRFDPVYTTDPMYVGHITGYQNELKSLVGPGVVLLDLTALSDYLYKAKSAKDLLADPMHPDDFMARLFAQSLMAMFIKP